MCKDGNSSTFEQNVKNNVTKNKLVITQLLSVIESICNSNVKNIHAKLSDTQNNITKKDVDEVISLDSTATINKIFNEGSIFITKNENEDMLSVNSNNKLSNKSINRLIIQLIN